MRMFIAVIPPEGVVDHLDEFLEPRREHGAFRWTSAEQLHVTLAFLEQVPERSLDALVEGLRRGATRRAPCETRVSGGGAFPDPAHAKVLYAGLALTVDARTELDRLATGARAAAGRAGLAVDGQRFRPHVTLARLGRGQEVTSWVRLLDAYEGPAFTVDRIALVESHLGEGPQRRPRHEVVDDFALGPRPAG